MHNLVVGISNSGKTQLCKLVANSNPNLDVIVFDPLKSGGWGNKAKCFSTIEAFGKYLEMNQKAIVFIDEAKIVFDEDKKLAEKWLYQFRHKGYLIYLIAQRAKMIPPNARNQCSSVYAFKQKPEDAKLLADEYGDEFAELPKLKPLEFIYSNGFETTKAAIQFNGNKPILKGRN